MPWFTAALVICLLAWGSPAQARRVALVIGNEKYVNEEELHNPVRDATLIAKVLKDDLHFDDVQLLSNRDRVAMVVALDQFATKARGAETAVIYYSGHGMVSEQQQNYVLPVDAKVDSDVLLRATAVEEQELIKAVGGADVKLVILDACRSTRNGRKGGTKGLRRTDPGADEILIAYATAEHETAEDGKEGTNSPYAMALARRLKTAASVSVLEMLDGVKTDVEAQTAGNPHPQRPTRSGSMTVHTYLVAPALAQSAAGGAQAGAVGAPVPGHEPAPVSSLAPVVTETAAPAAKPAPQVPVASSVVELHKGDLSLTSDAPCALRIDGDDQANLVAGVTRTIAVDPGPTSVECVSTEVATVRFQADTKVRSGKAGSLNIELAGKVRAAKSAERKARATELARSEREARFVERGDGTVLDRDTKLVWARSDNGASIDWKAADAYCRDKGMELPKSAELLALYDRNGLTSTRCGQYSDCSVSRKFRLSSMWFWSSERLRSPGGLEEAAMVQLLAGSSQSRYDGLLAAEVTRALCVRRP